MTAKTTPTIRLAATTHEQAVVHRRIHRYDRDVQIAVVCGTARRSDENTDAGLEVESHSHRRAWNPLPRHLIPVSTQQSTAFAPRVVLGCGANDGLPGRSGVVLHQLHRTTAPYTPSYLSGRAVSGLFRWG